MVHPDTLVTHLPPCLMLHYFIYYTFFSSFASFFTFHTFFFHLQHSKLWFEKGGDEDIKQCSSTAPTLSMRRSAIYLLERCLTRETASPRPRGPVRLPFLSPIVGCKGDNPPRPPLPTPLLPPRLCMPPIKHTIFIVEQQRYTTRVYCALFIYSHVQAILNHRSRLCLVFLAFLQG